jgi:hypothetical protein
VQQLDDGRVGAEGPEPGSKPMLDRRTARGRLTRLDWAYEVPYLLAVIGASALALTLAARRPGWPIGQTFGQDPLLVQIYAAHFRHGDLFPVWSSSDAFGMGSPAPLFYHKAFFILGGAIFILLGGALKTTLLLTLAIFMVVGAYGMRQALGVVTEQRLIQVVGSLGFLFTNWAFVEWLSRGDLAEFSALMVVPWILYWCLTLVKNRRVSWVIIPTMVVLVDAHSAVALVSTVVLGVTAATFVATFGVGGLRAVYLRLLIAASATALILAPMLVAELEMSRFYDPAFKITEFGATVSHNFAHPWWSYFYLPSYRWLSQTNTYLNIQLDFAITFILAVGLFTVIVRWARRRAVRESSALPAVDRPVVAILIVSLALYLFLQFRISLPVYDVLSPFKVITFPYRMMTFITPLALLLAAVVADWYLRVAKVRWPRASLRVPAAMAGVWLVVLILFSPVTAHEPPLADSFFPDAPFVPVDQLTPPPSVSFQAYPRIIAEVYPLFIEYLPKVDGSNGQELLSDAPLYQKLHAHHTEAASLSSVPCSVVEGPGAGFEALRVTYSVTCRGPTLVALPISYNPYTSIVEQSKGGGNRPIVGLHLRTDPRIVIRVRSGGTHTLVVHLPTLAQMLF